jgi:hypothetical protein
MIATAVVAGLLAGGYRIVQMNDAAMAGTMNGQPSGFYGH